MIKITEKQKYWLDHFQAADSSRMSLAGYARQHELDPNLFHSWVHQLRKRGLIPAAKLRRSSRSFARAEPAEQAVASLPADIVLPNGVRLRGVGTTICSSIFLDQLWLGIGKNLALHLDVDANDKIFTLSL